jgi:hypothetical protein
MNSSQLNFICRNDPILKHTFLGVFARDKLPTTPISVPCALIVNTDIADKDGEHWIAMYIDEQCNGNYFDSYGHFPFNFTEFRTFLDTNANPHWTFNTKRIQGSLSAVCGQYCLHFLMQMAKGLTIDEAVRNFSSYDFGLNDYTVARYVKRKFDFDMSTVISDDFIVKQICKAFTDAISQ